MEVGISSACFYPDFELEKSFKIMKKLGYDTGELFLNTYYEYSDDFVKKLIEEKEKNNFNVKSVHFFHLCMNLIYLINMREEEKIL